MYLHLTESSARSGMQVTAEAEHEYWLSRQKAAVKAPAEIDVHGVRLENGNFPTLSVLSLTSDFVPLSANP